MRPEKAVQERKRQGKQLKFLQATESTLSEEVRVTTLRVTELKGEQDTLGQHGQRSSKKLHPAAVSA